MKKFNVNQQWERINARLDGFVNDDLSSFKRNEKLFIFATQSPSRFGVAYLKTLLSLLGRNLTEEDMLLIDKISNRSFGNPITVTVRGRSICRDYLQALYEAKFVGSVACNVGRVVEIGAGYGRTCHALISIYENIEEYAIVDLDSCLALSKRYLSEVLEPSLFKKIKFVSNHDCEEYFVGLTKKNTLTINCDSINEMDFDVASSYLSLVSSCSDYFYSCNSICHYSPESFQEEDFDINIAKNHLMSGLVPYVVDVFDDQAVAANVDKYIDAMRPDKSWTLLDSAFTEMYTYYMHALYASDRN